MPTFVNKILLTILSAAVLFYTVYFTPAPASWDSASLVQLLLLFLPIIIGITSLSDIFLKNFARSLLVGLSAMLLLILQSLYLFNIITLAIIILCLVVLFYFFDAPPVFAIKPRFEKITKSLTSEAQIPKLTKFQTKRRRRNRR